MLTVSLRYQREPIPNMNITKTLNIFELERCLVSSLQYPINYGFIPQTIALDNDPLDVLVFNHDPIDRASLVSCRILGVLEFVDGGEIDNKVIAVPHWSPKEKYRTLNDIEDEHLKIYRQFFKIYKIDRKSETRVGQWRGYQKALDIVRDSYERWTKAHQHRIQQEWVMDQYFSKIKNKGVAILRDSV